MSRLIDRLYGNVNAEQTIVSNFQQDNTEFILKASIKDCLEKSETKEEFEKAFSGDLQKRFPNGKWVTINGSHVFINGGKVIAGLGGFNKEIDKFFDGKKDKNEIKVGDRVKLPSGEMGTVKGVDYKEHEWKGKKENRSTYKVLPDSRKNETNPGAIVNVSHGEIQKEKQQYQDTKETKKEDKQGKGNGLKERVNNSTNKMLDKLKSEGKISRFGEYGAGNKKVKEVIQKDKDGTYSRWHGMPGSNNYINQNKGLSEKDVKNLLEQQYTRKFEKEEKELNKESDKDFLSGKWKFGGTRESIAVLWTDQALSEVGENKKFKNIGEVSKEVKKMAKNSKGIDDERSRLLNIVSDRLDKQEKLEVDKKQKREKIKNDLTTKIKNNIDSLVEDRKNMTTHVESGGKMIETVGYSHNKQNLKNLKSKLSELKKDNPDWIELRDVLSNFGYKIDMMGYSSYSELRKNVKLDQLNIVKK